MSLRSWVDVSRMEEFARLDAPAQRLDARAKALVTLAFVVCVMSFPRYSVSALMPFALYPLVLSARGRIPALYLFRKMLLAAPFALVIALFNPIYDRAPAMVAGPLTISGGWLSCASVMARFCLTVGAALALVACTGMHRLCAGLERLGVPRVFAVQLLFLHRYLFVVADEGGRMMRSMELRGARPRALPLRLAGSVLGHLLLRAMARADRVHQAMVARGFDGEMRLLRPSTVRAPDVIFVAGWILYFAAARRWNLAGLLGQLLAGRVG
jgi:cobalt/nickel transport system permease protein